MNNFDLLFELGTQELPPTSLLNLSQSLCSNVKKSLEELRLSFTEIHPYATPRRLAFIIENLGDVQPDQTITKRGPPH